MLIILLGRLGTGSGSTPSIMVDGETKKPKYAVITDGVSPMNILFYDA